MPPKAKTQPKGAIQKSLKKGLSIRETAAATGTSRSSVHRTKQQMDAALKDPVLGPPLGKTPAKDVGMADKVMKSNKLTSTKPRSARKASR